MIDATNCRLEHLIERNKIFFSEGSKRFHGDRRYKIEREDGKSFLRVEGAHGVSYYEIGKYLQLNYTQR